MDIVVTSRENTQEQIVNSHESILETVDRSVFWSRLLKWQYWPFSVFYTPIAFYWLWLTIKTRSFFFFTASNPSIEFGGMLGESKAKIFDLIPDQYIPKTIKIEADISINQLQAILAEHEIQFPLICKPDIGERGWMVELINNETELEHYLNRIEVSFLAQAYINYPLELGVFYYRYPDCERGTISSVVMKDMLSVVGDGQHTVEELMQLNVHTKMHTAKTKTKSPDLMSKIPVRHEHVELNGIGNHSLGTTFLNGNHLINKALIDVFDKVSKHVDGFYFGRYDIRCASIEELYEGKNFKILELNGAGSEPAHIYQPGYPLLQAYRDIIHHLEVLSEISHINHQRGVGYMRFWDGIKEVMKIRQYNRNKPKEA